MSTQQQDQFARKMMSDLLIMEGTYTLSEGSWNHQLQRTERVLTNHKAGKAYLVYSTSDKPGSYSVAYQQ